MSILGIEEFKEKNIWKALVAEFIGTGFLTLVGCGSCTGSNVRPLAFVEIAICFGLIVGVMIQCIGHISGGHINPAVTAGMVVTGNCSLLRGLCYVVMQCIGAVVGAAILAAVLPSSLRDTLGQTNIHGDLSVVHGLFIEILITFVLVFTVFARVDPNRVDNSGSAPLIIGLSVTACHLWAIKYTGSSMNTARSFGPAVVGTHWENHWIYWVGPIVGGIIAGLLYKFLFAEPEKKANTSDVAETPIEPTA